ncbi:MAG: OmpH family outer membrane protein [Gammaproteobacteria bacterium]|jgi:outer membrane protein|nr:OmpH family outer membrane protein [Gammaproteobacteria bacterium]MBK9428445.1 OmpH family outer membrane protein [Gammaproteobacteria bacterium]
MLVLAFFALPAAAVDKIAVVDIQRVIFTSDVAKARQKQLQAESEFVGLQAKYDSIAADVKALQKKIEAERDTMSQEQATENQKKMEYLRADYELVERKLRAEVQQLQGKIMEELQPKVQAALKELVDAEGITLLLQREAVIVADPGLDVTSKLLERLNAKTK